MSNTLALIVIQHPILKTPVLAILPKPDTVNGSVEKKHLYGYILYCYLFESGRYSTYQARSGKIAIKLYYGFALSKPHLKELFKVYCYTLS